MLALTQHVLSHGVTSYSVPYGTVVILFICFVLQIGIVRITAIPLGLYSLSFLPAALLLVFLTNLLVFNWSIIIFCIGLFLLFMLWALFGLRSNEENVQTNTVQILMQNLLILTIVCGFTGAMSNTNDKIHYELRMQRCLLNDDAGGVLGVAEKFLQTNLRMTALRASALNSSGEMGSKLFEYPLCGKSKELLIPASDSVSMLYNPINLTAKIDSLPYESAVSVINYLQETMSRDTCRADSMAVRDYWLCALLLDKHLERFAQEFPKFYKENMKDVDSVPKHYREALVLYMRTTFNPQIIWNDDEVMNTNYEEFLKMQKSNLPPVAKENLLRRSFGETYWWYYNYR